MVWRRPLLSGGCSLVGVVAIVGACMLSACFADLPAPIACPPAEARAMGDCITPLDAAPINPTFCIAEPAVHECLLGSRDSCACTSAASECPEPAAACFPDEECPAVVKALAPDARCLRPGADAFVSPTPALEGCICGCRACARLCDGKGPSVGFKFPVGAGDPPAPLVIRLTSLLPAQGRLGVYVRIRGIANVAIVVGSAKNAIREEQIQVANQARFIERTTQPTPAWTDLSMAPELVAIIAQPGPTVAEVDCIIPYVMP